MAEKIEQASKGKNDYRTSASLEHDKENLESKISELHNEELELLLDIKKFKYDRRKIIGKEVLLILRAIGSTVLSCQSVYEKNFPSHLSPYISAALIFSFIYIRLISDPTDDLVNLYKIGMFKNTADAAALLAILQKYSCLQGQGTALKLEAKLPEKIPETPPQERPAQAAPKEEPAPNYKVARGKNGTLSVIDDSWVNELKKQNQQEVAKIRVAPQEPQEPKDLKVPIEKPNPEKTIHEYEYINELNLDDEIKINGDTSKKKNRLIK